MVVAELVRQGKAVEDARVRRHERLRRGGRVRQGKLHPHRLLQPAEDRRAGPQRRLRPADRAADRAEDGRPGDLHDVRPVPRGVPRAAAALHRRQDRRQPHHRADVRDADAGAVPVAHHRRLHRERPRLQRRRGALQHPLHHAGRAGHRGRQPVGHQVPRLRPRPRRDAGARQGRARRLHRPRVAAPAAAQQDAEIRQRRRVRRRVRDAAVRRPVQR